MDRRGREREEWGNEEKRRRDEWEVCRLCFLLTGTGRTAAFNSQLLHPDTGTTTDLLGHWTLMFHFTCLCTLHTYRLAPEIMFIINCRNTTLIHTQRKGFQRVLVVSAYSKLLNTCNTFLSFIVWHEIKDAQGGVEKRSLTVTSTTQYKKVILWEQEQFLTWIVYSGICFLLSCRMTRWCVNYSLSSAHIRSFLTCHTVSHSI